MDTNQLIETFISDNQSLIKLKSQCLFKENELNNQYKHISPSQSISNTEYNDDWIKHLFPNTIVSGIIVDITYDSNTKKKQMIIFKIKESLAILYNEIKPDPIDVKIDIKSYNITGVVNQNEIYDKQLVHLNEIVDSNLIVGNEITAMVFDINIEQKVIYLTLRNSCIKGKHQMFVQGNDYQLNIPFNLGMPIKHEHEERNECYLSNKIFHYNIFEYGTISDKVPSFNYEILRKIQNYDWSDEYASKGDYFAQKGLFILAIENFDEAEKLDPLNPEVYIKKGTAWLKMEDEKKASSCFKNCLKIDPNNTEARAYIEKMHSIQNNKHFISSYGNELKLLNKKRKNV